MTQTTLNSSGTGYVVTNAMFNAAGSSFNVGGVLIHTTLGS